MVMSKVKLKPGDRIDFIVQEDGKVVVKPATTDVGELKRILHRSGRKTVSAEAMNRAIRKRMRGR